MRQTIFGVTLDDLDLPQAVAAIGDAVAARAHAYVVTPNVDHVVRLRRDPLFRLTYEHAALCLVDSVPLVIAARLVGRPLVGRVAGSDLLPALCRLAVEQGYSVALFGGRGGVALRAAAVLKANHPALRIATVYTPPDDFQIEGPDAEAAVAALNLAKPDILFVGLGSPKQELWVHWHWDRLAVTVAVCCGAALDYAAGAKPRAPAWMQRAGLEWLWRLAHEPRRLWRRYLVDDLAFLGIVLKEWWRLRVRKSSG